MASSSQLDMHVTDSISRDVLSDHENGQLLGGPDHDKPDDRLSGCRNLPIADCLDVQTHHLSQAHDTEQPLCYAQTAFRTGSL